MQQAQSESPFIHVICPNILVPLYLEPLKLFRVNSNILKIGSKVVFFFKFQVKPKRQLLVMSYLKSTDLYSRLGEKFAKSNPKIYRHQPKTINK